MTESSAPNVGTYIDIYCEVVEEYPANEGTPKFLLVSSLDKKTPATSYQVFSDNNHKFAGQTLAKGAKFSAVGEVISDNQGTLVLCLSKFKKSYDKPAAKAYTKDNSGMETGHALNAAFYWGASPGQLKSKAKEMHTLTVRLKERYAEHMERPATEYGIGAATGNAVLLACRYKQGESVEVLEATAWAILTKVVPEVTKFVKGEE